MLVRVYDKEKNRYYRSIVYAVLGTGVFEKMIVLEPNESEFRLIDVFDKTDKHNYKRLCMTINPDTSSFATREKAYILKIKKHLNIGNRALVENMEFFMGYEDVLENAELIASLLCGKTITASETDIKPRESEDGGIWNYIQTQKDADVFMELFAGFHDAYIRKITYEESAYPNIATVYAVFESCWYGTAELCFEAVSELHLHSPGELYTSEIYDATLLVNEERVFWADDYMEEENTDRCSSYIKALSLKWRTIEENKTVNF